MGRRRTNVVIAETEAVLSRAARSSSRWYERAVIYELHVRSFYDSDSNGAGDFAGLIQKLDYIQDLGVTALWLLPFCPSPWRDDGYDISDYVGVHPAYGCLDDFQRFLHECQRRGLRVITELVLNHTSDQHPWFQRARQSPPGSQWREFYVWSDTPDRYAKARIIFTDFESSNWTWDAVAGAYYWHRFFSHQPDLNFDSPDVREAVKETVDFWFSMGVDGLRLDAVPYLFEREGTTCENLPETHAFLRDLRQFVDARYEDRMLLAEANQWPDDAAEYFGNGDECHMAFNFPLMPRLFMATRIEDSFPITNIIRQTPTPPAGCQWATFLRNHDELTLEMVCDEERDFMYRTYAHDPVTRINVGIRRRLAPLLENDRRLIRLTNALLLSLPGTPVIYYGDEIGMGDDTSLGDRNGVRTPMQWSAERNAGFSSADESTLYLPAISHGEYAHQFVNVEAEERKRSSLLWWMRHALSIRKQSEALSAGTSEVLTHRNRHVLTFVRTCQGERVLVVANLSRYAQPVQLPLVDFIGYIPVELFGRVEFPPIATEPYQLTLAPYGFYWFALRMPETDADIRVLPELDLNDRTEIARVLRPNVRSAEVSRPRDTTHVEVIDTVAFSDAACLAVVRVSFTAGEPELQLWPLTLSEVADQNCDASRSVLARVTCRDGRVRAIRADASVGNMSNALVELIAGERETRTGNGVLRGFRLPSLGPVLPSHDVCLLPASPAGPQRNTSVLLSGIYVLKLFRQLEAGTSPEISTVEYLFEKAGFSHVPPVFGKLVYTDAENHTFDAGVLLGYVENRTDLWQLTMDELSLYIERRAANSVATARRGLDSYLDLCRLLARQTAAMHLALAAAGPEYLDIAPEPFDPISLRGAAYSMASLARSVQETIDARQWDFDIRGAGDALESACGVFAELPQVADAGLKIRTHGDFHLGQVLYTGDDLVFIDFEGDVTRPLRQRLIKTSALADVASMLYSFRSAAVSTSFRDISGPFAWHSRADQSRVSSDEWYRAVSSVFLNTYCDAVSGRKLAPSVKPEFWRLIQIYLRAKAVYQLGYEIRHRPEWLPIAARTLLEITADKMA